MMTMQSRTIVLLWLSGLWLTQVRAASLPYPIVDTGQIRCYNNTNEIKYPKPGDAFFGQDAHYNGNQPAYKDNGDGTVTDLNTELMWIQNPGSKKTFEQAAAGAPECKVGGYADWRLPTIKELYSLILFSGTDPDPMSTNTSRQRPFIDTEYFKFSYGRQQDGDRIIDSQFATSTIYRSTTMNGNKTMFGVNFADGRIKGYGLNTPRGEKTFYVLYVRGNADYGKNQYVDNGDGTITDKATGLMWQKSDSGKGLNWSQALNYAEKLDLAGYSDWRLPNAKELQSIVDYSRCPDVTNSAAIGPVFEVTPITNEGGKKDYSFYWTSSSHCGVFSAQAAAYVAFGRSQGWMQDRRSGEYKLMDVHGAGSQRSDPKTGDASKFPRGRGPQGDVIRINNPVRCVRGGTAEPRTSGPKIEMEQSRSRNQRGRQQPDQRGMQNGQRMQPPSQGRGGQGPSGGDFVNRLDRDGDGRVSRSEFDGPSQHFRQLDRDNDGFLSADEAPNGPPPERGNLRQRR